MIGKTCAHRKAKRSIIKLKLLPGKSFKSRCDNVLTVLKFSFYFPTITHPHILSIV